MSGLDDLVFVIRYLLEILSVEMNPLAVEDKFVVD